MEFAYFNMSLLKEGLFAVLQGGLNDRHLPQIFARISDCLRCFALPLLHTLIFVSLLGPVQAIVMTHH